jgi:hypothetical protein
MEQAGLPAPNSTDWWFEIFSLRYYGQAINDLAINYLPPDYDPNALANYYSLLCIRGDDLGYMGREFNGRSFQTWAPEPSTIHPGDYLLCIKITETVVGVYWITTSDNIPIPAAFFCDTLDPLFIEYDMPLTRVGGMNGTPFYVMRGDGDTSSDTVYSSINEHAINTIPINGSNDQAIAQVTTRALNYRDKYNSVAIDRSGITLKHAVELL